MTSVSDFRKRKIIILWAAMLLEFFTGLSKVTVPGPIFNQLQGELGFSAADLAVLSGCFMYAYAISQFLLGIYSDRCGGPRLLLIGAANFAIGQAFFPFLDSLALMCVSRAFTALGSGIIFLGVTKLINDIYSRKFTFILGIAMLISYLGPAAGGSPLSFLLASFKWRSVYSGMAILAIIPALVIMAEAPQVMRKIIPGSAFAQLKQVFVSKSNICLFIGISIMFGIYYALLILCGQKCLRDYLGMTATASGTVITCMAMLTAVLNFATSFLLKYVFRESRKVFLTVIGIFIIAGTFCGLAAFLFQNLKMLLLPAFFIIAVPSGLFTFYGTVTKELNSGIPALSIAMLNFAAFIGIAVTGNIAGMIMKHFEKSAELAADGAFTYPAAAYMQLFVFFCAAAVISFLLTLPVPETRTDK